MKHRFIAFLVALVLAFAGTSVASASSAKAAVPDAGKWQQCYHETMPSGKVRYTVQPKASFEVDEVRIAGKQARINAAGTFYRIMDSQEMAGKHWVYLNIFGEAQGFGTWAKCKPLY